MVIVPKENKQEQNICSYKLFLSVTHFTVDFEWPKTIFESVESLK